MLNYQDIRIAIIGAGHVGFPLGLLFANSSCEVILLDTDVEKIKLFNQDKSFFSHITDNDLTLAKNCSKSFKISFDFSEVANCEYIILCLPTPLENNQPDLSYVKNAMNSILPYLKKNQLISLESTTYPGSTRSLLAEPLIAHGFSPGEDIFIVYSPEREDPGTTTLNLKHIPKVLSGYTSECTRRGEEFYNLFFNRIVLASSIEVAEMSKLIENSFRAVNIALINELKFVCESMNVDIWESIEAASTKPFGYMPFYPGPGIGGHCIPKDPVYLNWAAKKAGYHSQLIEYSIELNSSLPLKTFNRMNSMLVGLNDVRILVLGVSYKKNIADTRFSPAIEIIKIIQNNKIDMDYFDPFVPKIDGEINLESIEISAENLNKYTCVLLLTDHDIIDYLFILNHSKLIFDTRNKFKSIHNEKIIRI